jgi:rSAM/selenodomain-associated transferase 1
MDNPSRRTHAIAIMAKAPIAGAVKSRLVPPLTFAEAAALNRAFVRDLCAAIGAARTIVAAAADGAETRVAGFIAYSPAGAEGAFAGLVPADFTLFAQQGDGLTARLIHAAEDLLGAGYDSVTLMNSDSPTIPPATIAGAIAALDRAGDRVVIGGADDGGYCLIGLKRSHRRLFEEITWSTAAVMAQTLERAAELGLEVVAMPPWYDVDDAASLRRLIDELFGPSARAAAANEAPATRAAITDLLAGGLAERLAGLPRDLARR